MSVLGACLSDMWYFIDPDFEREIIPSYNYLSRNATIMGIKSTKLRIRRISVCGDQLS